MEEPESRSSAVVRSSKAIGPEEDARHRLPRQRPLQHSDTDDGLHAHATMWPQAPLHLGPAHLPAPPATQFNNLKTQQGKRQEPYAVSVSLSRVSTPICSAA
jgi:hypothetical protein